MKLIEILVLRNHQRNKKNYFYLNSHLLHFVPLHRTLTSRYINLSFSSLRNKGLTFPHKKSLHLQVNNNNKINILKVSQQCEYLPEVKGACRLLDNLNPGDKIFLKKNKKEKKSMKIIKFQGWQ